MVRTYENRDCLLEAYHVTECPNCGKNIASASQNGAQQVLCNLNNEGGLQTDLDLLLLLASNYDLMEFPPLVFQEAASMGIMRGLTEDKVDIRSLRDANGKTAEDYANEIGGVWNGWTGNGRLAI